MSGHSKWATIKHKKGALDAKRGKLFAKIARQLEVAARQGGGDPSSNATLRTVVLKAKAGQMTNDAIDRAIKRGTGESDGGTYEAIMYEGYAPGGVGILIDVLTDNRNRTGSEVRAIFSKLGGAMAEPGAVGWQFARRGVVQVARKAAEDDLMMAALEAGADDISDQGDSWQVACEPSSLFDVKGALETAGFEVLSAESTMLAENTIPITDAEDARKILRIIDALEDNDDVQDVYSNVDITEELMSQLDV
jgi:transcriptional/translational regulatory protein YebC/TACO1